MLRAVLFGRKHDQRGERVQAGLLHASCSGMSQAGLLCDILGRALDIPCYSADVASAL